MLIGDAPNISIVAESTSALSILAFLKNNEIDILITDIMMPGMDGYELAMAVRKENYKVKILALSMNEDGAMITKMIEQAVVDGYIPKASGKQELVKAIENIIGGDTYFSKSVKDQYKLYKKIKSQGDSINLTNRELQIIECMVQHLSNKEIGNKLFISERTVETHRKNIFRKTDTKGIPALAQFVKKYNLLP